VTYSGSVGNIAANDIVCHYLSFTAHRARRLSVNLLLYTTHDNNKNYKVYDVNCTFTTFGRHLVNPVRPNLDLCSVCAVEPSQTATFGLTKLESTDEGHKL
jgi:hypothetical protein